MLVSSSIVIMIYANIINFVSIYIRLICQRLKKHGFVPLVETKVPNGSEDAHLAENGIR